MNPKTTLTLVVVLALAGSLLFLTSQGKQATTDLEGPTKGSVEIIDSDLLGPSLSQITFYSGNFFPIQLERIEGEWFVTSPHRFPANSAVIDKSLETLADLRGEPSDRDIGSIRDGDGVLLNNKDHEIYLALREKIGAGKAELQVYENGQPQLYIVNDELHELHEQVFEQNGHHKFYAKKILPLLMPDYVRIEIETIEYSAALRQIDQQWFLGEGVAPERALETRIGDHPGIADFFKLLESLEIDQFVDYFGDEDAAKYGLTRPLITVRFVPLGADPKRTNAGMTLRIGSPADLADQTRYCSYGQSDNPYPVVFTAPTPIALAFGQSAERFRDPRLTALPKLFIKTIKIEQPNRRNTMLQLDPNRRGTLIALDTELGDYPVDLGLMGSEILDLLLEERVKEYLEVEPENLIKIGTITLEAPLKNETESLHLYETAESELKKGSVFIRRGKESTLLLFDRNPIDRLLNLHEQLKKN